MKRASKPVKSGAASRSAKETRLPVASKPKPTASSKRKDRIPTPPPPQPVDDYEDDFESYESDFEDDFEDEEPSVKEEVPRPAPPATRPKKEDRPVTRQEIEESPLISKLQDQRRQQRQPQKAQNPPSTKDASTTVVARTITFSASSYAHDPEGLYKASDAFKLLKDSGALSIVRNPAVDCAPGRVSGIFHRIVEGDFEKQRYCQTGDDDTDNVAQTEPPESAESSTQHPENAAVRQRDSTAMSAPSGTTRAPASTTSSRVKASSRNSANMSTFLGIAERLFSSLSSSVPNRKNGVSSTPMPLRAKYEFSQGYMELTLPESVVKDAKVTCLSVSPQQRNRVIVTYYSNQKWPSTSMAGSLLVEYELLNQEEPVNVLFTGNQISDATYSSDGSLLFCGNLDGSCSLFDLSESADQLITLTWPNRRRYGVRIPAYDTSYLVLTRMSPLKFTDQTEYPILKCKGFTGRNAQQCFISVDSRGIIEIHAVIQSLSATSTEFVQDLGLRPGARSRLIRLTTVVGNGTAFPCTACEINCVNGLKVVLGLANGTFTSLSRNEWAEVKLLDKNNNTSARCFGSKVIRPEPTYISVSPFHQNVFAVGTASGDILIYQSGISEPIILLTDNRFKRVSSIKWSPNISSSLYALYGDKSMSEWSLTSPKRPRWSGDIDEAVLSVHAWANEQGRSFLALGFSSGKCAVHELHSSIDGSATALDDVLARLLP